MTARAEDKDEAITSGGSSSSFVTPPAGGVNTDDAGEGEATVTFMIANTQSTNKSSF